MTSFKNINGIIEYSQAAMFIVIKLFANLSFIYCFFKNIIQPMEDSRKELLILR